MKASNKKTGRARKEKKIGFSSKRLKYWAYSSEQNVVLGTNERNRTVTYTEDGNNKSGGRPEAEL